jgi:hypothetical protein
MLSQTLVTSDMLQSDQAGQKHGGGRSARGVRPGHCPAQAVPCNHSGVNNMKSITQGTSGYSRVTNTNARISLAKAANWGSLPGRLCPPYPLAPYAPNVTSIISSCRLKVVENICLFHSDGPEEPWEQPGRTKGESA